MNFPAKYQLFLLPSPFIGLRQLPDDIGGQIKKPYRWAIHQYGQWECSPLIFLNMFPVMYSL